jgi:hypothetical protein
MFCKNTSPDASERALGLRVASFMPKVEWDVKIFCNCTTWKGMNDTLNTLHITS